MVYAITATPERSAGRVRLNASGGTPGDTLYVFRRDSAGVGVVRDTSEGTVVWAADGTVVVYDHEARQGVDADYLLADGDGTTLATVRVTLPLWGTWLKSPGRPYRNVRCYYHAEGEVTAAARREVVTIEGASQPVVLSEVRAGRTGQIALVARDQATADAIRLLLSDGLTLMLDTPPSWAVPFRYLSAGDAVWSRPLAVDGQLGLDAEARVVTLSDVVAEAIPFGVTVVDPGRTYEVLPTLYGSYAAMAAVNSTYEVLATGTEL